jgi:hypothetical protein
MDSFFVFLFSTFSFTALLIWKPREPAKPLLDRVAWTIFGFGVHSMFFMALYGIAHDGEGGGLRSWETIRYHTRLFFLCAAVATSGPMFVCLRQALTPYQKSVGVRDREDCLD